MQSSKSKKVSNGSQASTADVPAPTESARATTVPGDRKRPWMLTPCQIRSSRSIGIPTVCNQPTWVVNAGATLAVADGDGTRRLPGRAMESSSLRFAQHTAIFESSRRLPLNPPSCAQGAPAPTSSAGRMYVHWLSKISVGPAIHEYARSVHRVADAPTANSHSLGVLELTASHSIGPALPMESSSPTGSS